MSEAASGTYSKTLRFNSHVWTEWKVNETIKKRVRAIITLLVHGHQVLTACACSEGRVRQRESKGVSGRG
jgi:hypothetical protein